MSISRRSLWAGILVIPLATIGLDGPVPASAQVAGVAGCIIPDSSVSVGGGGGGSGRDVDNCSSFTNGSGRTVRYGVWATAAEVNQALQTLQQNITNQINQIVNNGGGGGGGGGGSQPPVSQAPTGDSGKDAEQDARLGTHDGQIADLYNRDASQGSLISSLQSQVSSQGSMISSLSQQISNINAVNAQQQSQLDDYGARITRAENNIVKLDGRVTEHDKTLAAHTATLASHSETLSNHSVRLDQAENDISTLYRRTTLTNTLVGQQGTLNGSQSNQIGSQAGVIADQGAQIANQGSQLADQGSALQQQGSQIAGLQQQALATDDQLANLNTAIANQGVTLAEHENRIIKNEQNITKLDNRVTQHDVILADHETRIGKNEKDIATLDTRVTQHDATLADHETRITNNTKDIATLDTRVSDHDKTLADHETRITTNEHDIANINDTGVFYDTDASGKKTGGLTFNDGTGSPVQLRNVAAGRAGTDAVNVAQLSSAVKALGGGAKLNSDGSVSGPTYVVGGQDYVDIGDALKATNEMSVQYVVDAKGKRTDDVVLNGTGKGPVAIHNLADGKVASDAATLRQVYLARDESMAYTDQSVTALSNKTDNQFFKMNGEIASTRKEARGGVASAMAMASMRYDSAPGKTVLAAGFGNFKGESAITAGVGYTSEDGRWKLNAGLSRNFGTGDFGFNAGLAVTLD